MVFPGGSDGKESTCNAGDSGSISGLGRSPGEGNDNPLQYSCLEKSMDRGAWQATVHGVAKESDTTEWLTLSFTKYGMNLLQEGGPLQGPKQGLLFITQELSEEIQMLTKQGIFLGGGAWEESRRVREPRRTALPCGLQSWVLW